jgi:RimJ/RimL family protein N-acetyltransferase
VIAHPLTLQGRLVRLEPLEAEHIPALMAVATAHPETYRFTSTPVTAEQASAYFGRAFRERDEGLAYPFVLLEEGSGRVVGSSRYSDIRWGHRNCELGYTWLHPEVQGGGVNVEAKLLMLGYAFEALDFLRVYFYTDTRNEHSQRAVRALGAKEEGVLRCHMVMKDGFVRDSLVFSVVHFEWPEVKAGLEARLERKRAAQRG